MRLDPDVLTPTAGAPLWGPENAWTQCPKENRGQPEVPGGCRCLWQRPGSLRRGGRGILATNEERQQAVLTPEDVSFRGPLCISAPWAVLSSELQTCQQFGVASQTSEV